MKLFELQDRHVKFVATTFRAQTGLHPSVMPEETKVVVAEADEPDAEGQPVYLGWAAVAGDCLVWSYVPRGSPQLLPHDRAMLRHLGLNVDDGAEVKALFDGSPIRRIAKRYNWTLRF